MSRAQISIPGDHIVVYRKKTNAMVAVPFNNEQCAAVALRIMDLTISRNNLDAAADIEEALRNGMLVVANGYSAKPIIRKNKK